MDIKWNYWKIVNSKAGRIKGKKNKTNGTTRKQLTDFNSDVSSLILNVNYVNSPIKG